MWAWWVILAMLQIEANGASITLLPMNGAVSATVFVDADTGAVLFGYPNLLASDISGVSLSTHNSSDCLAGELASNVSVQSLGYYRFYLRGTFRDVGSPGEVRWICIQTSRSKFLGLGRVAITDSRIGTAQPFHSRAVLLGYVLGGILSICAFNWVLMGILLKCKATRTLPVRKYSQEKDVEKRNDSDSQSDFEDEKNDRKLSLSTDDIEVINNSNHPSSVVTSRSPSRRSGTQGGIPNQELALWVPRPNSRSTAFREDSIWESRPVSREIRHTSARLTSTSQQTTDEVRPYVLDSIASRHPKGPNLLKDIQGRTTLDGWIVSAGDWLHGHDPSESSSEKNSGVDADVWSAFTESGALRQCVAVDFEAGGDLTFECLLKSSGPYLIQSNVTLEYFPAEHNRESSPSYVASFSTGWMALDGRWRLFTHSVPDRNIRTVMVTVCYRKMLDPWTAGGKASCFSLRHAFLGYQRFPPKDASQTVGVIPMACVGDDLIKDPLFSELPGVFWFPISGQWDFSPLPGYAASLGRAACGQIDVGGIGAIYQRVDLRNVPDLAPVLVRARAFKVAGSALCAIRAEFLNSSDEVEVAWNSALEQAGMKGTQLAVRTGRKVSRYTTLRIVLRAVASGKSDARVAFDCVTAQVEEGTEDGRVASANEPSRTASPISALWNGLTEDVAVVKCGPNLLKNGRADVHVALGWNTSIGEMVQAQRGGLPVRINPKEGSYFFSPGMSKVSEIFQDVSLSNLKSGCPLLFRMYIARSTSLISADEVVAHEFSIRFTLEFRTSKGRIIASHDSGQLICRSNTWRCVGVERDKPYNCESVRVRIACAKGEGCGAYTFNGAAFDDVFFGCREGYQRWEFEESHPKEVTTSLMHSDTVSAPRHFFQPFHSGTTGRNGSRQSDAIEIRPFSTEVIEKDDIIAGQSGDRLQDICVIPATQPSFQISETLNARGKLHLDADSKKRRFRSDQPMEGIMVSSPTTSERAGYIIHYTSDNNEDLCAGTDIRNCTGADFAVQEYAAEEEGYSRGTRRDNPDELEAVIPGGVAVLRRNSDLPETTHQPREMTTLHEPQNETFTDNLTNAAEGVVSFTPDLREEASLIGSGAPLTILKWVDTQVRNVTGEPYYHVPEVEVEGIVPPEWYSELEGFQTPRTPVTPLDGRRTNFISSSGGAGGLQSENYAERIGDLQGTPQITSPSGSRKSGEAADSEEDSDDFEASGDISFFIPAGEVQIPGARGPVVQIQTSRGGKGRGVEGPNLVVNPSAEAPPRQSGWTVVSGYWVQGNPQATGTITPHKGVYHFFAGITPRGELCQIVKIADCWPQTAPRGTLAEIRFRAWVAAWGDGDTPRVILDFMSSAGVVVDTFDSGQLRVGRDWTLVEHKRLIPDSIAACRVTLIAVRNSGLACDGYFDDVYMGFVHPIPKKIKPKSVRSHGHNKSKGLLNFQK